ITHSHGVMERNIIRMQCITKCQNDRDKCLHQAVLADDQYQNQCMLLAQGCLESCYYPQASYITVNPYL
ncbi:MAG TPA: hypothetical protein VHA52_05415, partial [Candidatus Babeliaceae bacterium]|nr:hypothetical protein [Candidatus Babeliaceae bacterium]